MMRKLRNWPARDPGVLGISGCVDGFGTSKLVTADEIIIPEGRRGLDDAKVAALAESIKVLGLLSRPIVRLDMSNKSYVLVAGAHRLEALKRLGLGARTIEVLECVFDATQEDAELIEIDENLIRADLTPAERAKANARRKAIWEAAASREAERADADAAEEKEWRDGLAREAADKENARRDARKNEVRTADAPQSTGRGGARPQKKGYVEDAMRATGQSRRAIEKDVARASALGSETLDKIAADVPQHKVADLDALTQVEPEKRGEVIAAVKRGEALSIREAVTAAPTVLDADLALSFQVKRIQSHWTSFRQSFQHQPAAARTAWFEQHGGELVRVLGLSELAELVRQMQDAEAVEARHG